MLISQMSFGGGGGGEPVVASPNVGCFLRLIKGEQKQIPNFCCIQLHVELFEEKKAFFFLTVLDFAD